MEWELYDFGDGKRRLSFWDNEAGSDRHLTMHPDGSCTRHRYRYDGDEEGEEVPTNLAAELADALRWWEERNKARG